MPSLTKLVENLETYILNPLMTLLLAAGLLMFFWGLAQFILNAGSEEGRSIGKKHMLWGIIGVFIMFTAREIVKRLTI